MSAFLTLQFYTGLGTGACTINVFLNCETVRNRPWSSFVGIPTAAAGLAGFLLLLARAVAGFRGVERLGPLSIDAWFLGFALLGAAIGAGLTYIEIFVIQALCLFCASGFVLDLGVLATALALRRTSRSAAAS